jgi:hypothetical protein
MTEAILKQIAKNTKPKQSFQIILSSKLTNFNTKFNPPIHLNKDSSYEIALVNLETYYSFPNIDKNNNTLYFRKLVKNSGIPERFSVRIPIGSYEIDDLNKVFADKLKREGHGKVVTFTPNLNTLKCIMKIEDGYQINFRKNELGALLGFSRDVYSKGYYKSKLPININNISSIFINIDIASGSYVNGVTRPIIYSFFPEVSPGYKIVENPRNLVYLPIAGNMIDHINTKITDQDFNELNSRGENITLRFHIREV